MKTIVLIIIIILSIFEIRESNQLEVISNHSRNALKEDKNNLQSLNTNQQI